MSNRNLKHSLRSTLASLALASSLTGVVAACSADAPTVTQVPSSISVQAPEAATAEGVSFYYEGTKTSVKITDAAVLFAACTLKTSDTTKIVDFVNKTLKAGPIQDRDVTGLGDPLKPAISDFNGNGVVNCEDAAILFAVSTVGVDAAKVNAFVSGTLKLPEVKVTQTQLDTFFKTPATPTPTPTSTPTPTPTPTINALQVTPNDLKLPSGSSQSVTVSLPSAPTGNVTVTVTPSSDITATPATLTFTPTVFSGTVTVGSTATPGTTGTVKFSAPGYADGVVNVTVGQSTNLVVDPASLSIPVNGAVPFTVKLANAPTAPVTVTVTTSTPDLTTNPASLTFTPTNFNFNQAVLVRAEVGAVPGAQSLLLNAGPLGQFKLPVTITPFSRTTFFIDPVNGNNASPGTAAQPWATVKNAVDINSAAALRVAELANAGNNVVVTILGGVNVIQPSGGAITTPTLFAGSVTVLQDLFPKTFTLNMGNNQLILNKGYKLQDIKITSTFGGAGAPPAVKITHPMAGLASVDVKCAAPAGTPVTCVQVAGAGSHTLRDVSVDVTDDTGGNIGILNNDPNANLSIVGGRVQPINGDGNPLTTNPVTLIDSLGVLTVTGVTVDMTNAGHAQASKGIILRAPTSVVTRSTINVSNNAAAAGIKVQATASKSTIESNLFTASGAGIGVNGVGTSGTDNLFSSALDNNTFSGTFTAKVQ
jgi:hypothetical protein